MFVLVGLVVVVAGLVRAPELRLAPGGEELALVAVRGIPLLHGFDQGTNPLLLPWLANLAPHDRVVDVGRLLSFVCGLATIAVGARLAARVAPDDPVAPVLAAALLAVGPQVVFAGTVYRAYAPWLLLVLLHVDATARGAPRAWGATAAALPWVHYLSFPWLAALHAPSLATAAGRARLRAAGPWFLVAALPLVWVLFGERDGVRTGSAGFLAEEALRTLGASRSAWPGAVLLALVAGPALRVAAARPLVGAVGAALVAVVATAPLHAVRTPAQALVVAPFAVLVAVLPGWPAPVRGVARAAFGAALFVAWVRYSAHPPLERSTTAAIAEIVDDWDAVRDLVDGAPVAFPGGVTDALVYEVVGSLPQRLPEDARTEDGLWVDGVEVVPLRGGPGWILGPVSGPAAVDADGCEPARRWPHAVLARCR